MLYKVGDKVRVRSDLSENRGYCMLLKNGERDEIWDEATVTMLRLSGKVVTIESTGRKYTLKEDTHWWTDEMFEGLVIEAEPVPSKPTKSSLDWALENLF